MDKQVGVTEIRKQFATILNDVEYRGDNYVILRRGEPVAALVPMRVYRQWQQERQELFDLLRQAQERNRDADPDQVLEDALQAQRAVRQAEAGRAP